MTLSFAVLVSCERGPEPAAAELPPAALRDQLAFTVAPGFELQLFAAEPDVLQPVALSIDEQGAVYVAESFRVHQGVHDNERNPFWLLDDLACRTVSDRLRVLQKWASRFEGGMAHFSRHEDRVRRLQDADGDGVADRAEVFADGFREPLSGLGAGVLATGGQVYYTCIPALWQLRRDPESGAFEKKTLLQGFGVRHSYSGHDLHALIIGPDGRLYFTVGDRGYHVESASGPPLADPGGGAVFRCELDGSNLEVIFTGLRNPQGLAFDDFGNWITADNNADCGDRARIVYVVEGGDAGWNMAFQYQTGKYLRGPWKAERLWELAGNQLPAWVLPPIAHLAAGPAGICCTPGTAFPSAYRNHFLLADYTGGPGTIWSFALQPRGAAFELADVQTLLTGPGPTDVEFGFDGKLYISDWTRGFVGNGLGRIHTLYDPDRITAADTLQVQQLFAAGFDERPVTELENLLRHADRRVRLEAQFQLARRDEAGREALVAAARQTEHRLARLHGLWGIAQQARQGSLPADVEQTVLGLMQDRDEEVRAQAAKVAGDLGLPSAKISLISLLEDPAPRVRMFAALAAAKLPGGEFLSPLLDLLRRNQGEDAYLRHAAVMGLTALPDAGDLLRAAEEDEDEVRLGVLLALRRRGDGSLRSFLQDSQLKIVAEAARAVYDLPRAEELPELAALLLEFCGGKAAQRIAALEAEDRDHLEPLLRRLVFANDHLAEAHHARTLADFAARGVGSLAMRQQAVDLLATWEEARPLDGVLGLYRPRPAGEPGVVEQVLEPHWQALLTSAPSRLRQRVLRLCARRRIDPLPMDVADWIGDEEQAGMVRVEALRYLAEIEDTRVPQLLELASASRDVELRSEALQILGRTQPDRALTYIQKALQSGHTAERQFALKTLGRLKDSRADPILASYLQRLLSGNLDPTLHLDVLEASRRRSDPRLRGPLQRMERNLSSAGLLEKFRMVLHGGDAERGQALFLSNARAQCLRCHQVGGEGGTVGPALDGVGAQQSRERLLESLLLPDERIARGFHTEVVFLINGDVHSGLVQEDTETVLTLQDQDQIQRIPHEKIRERQRGKSAMPEDLAQNLSTFEIRDLLEFLTTLREES
jgi:quinoprotein glucose dehydrogenase